ncbi:MAG: hypothetical protein ACRDEA_05640 [Microcystaceae cyanobacterium]
MLINKLHLFLKDTQAQAHSTAISLHHFVDFDLDTVGWYTLGHHDPQDFMTAVVQRDSNFNVLVAQVQLTWAIFQDNDFEITDSPVPGSQAITLIEDFGESDFDSFS